MTSDQHIEDAKKELDKALSDTGRLRVQAAAAAVLRKIQDSAGRVASVMAPETHDADPPPAVAT